jgi:hypothetical protein
MQHRVAERIGDHQIQAIVLEQPTCSLRNSRKHIANVQHVRDHSEQLVRQRDGSCRRGPMVRRFDRWAES